MRKLPKALGEWALDSGGFSELSLFGAWATSAEKYVDEIRRWSEEIGGMRWAAIQDWMCEPWILEKTGLDRLQHQRNTVKSYCELKRMAPEVNWLPVVQGFTLDDYLRCVEMYRSEGIELSELPLVGIGSVCRRQATQEIDYIVRSVSDECGLRLHGFGVKLKDLSRLSGVLRSADSMAWSFGARRSKPLEGCTHKNCANCFRYATHWLGKIQECLGEQGQDRLPGFN